MTQRVIQLHRVLKPTSSFYIHIDPTASHYLKIVLNRFLVRKTLGMKLFGIMGNGQTWQNSAKKIMTRFCFTQRQMNTH